MDVDEFNGKYANQLLENLSKVNMTIFYLETFLFIKK